MTDKELQEKKDWFNKYTNKYLIDYPALEKNLTIKIKHTKGVLDAASTICGDIGANENDTNIAAACALFHDIGRFEQYAKHQTFSDDISTDHGNLGAKVLLDNKVLEDIKEHEKQNIICAVQYHNKKSIPQQLDKKNLFFTKLTRDADKIDIFRVVTDHYQQKGLNSSLTLDLPNDDKYSEKAINDIMNNSIVDKSYLITVNDFKLLQISWVFDLNFNKSFELINNKGYIDIIFNNLPQNEDIKKARKHIKSFMADKLNYHQISA